MWRTRFWSNLSSEKLTNQMEKRERDPTKGTHKNKYEYAGCFQLEL